MATADMTVEHVTHCWTTDTEWNWVNNTWLSVAAGYETPNNGWKTYVSQITIKPKDTYYCNSIKIKIALNSTSKPEGCRAKFSDAVIKPNKISISNTGESPVTSTGSAFSGWTSGNPDVYFNIPVDKILTKDTKYYIYVYPRVSETSKNTRYCIWGKQIAGSNITATADYKQEYTISYNANGGTDAPEPHTKIHGAPLTLKGKENMKRSPTSGGTYTITLDAATNGGYVISGAKALYPNVTISYTPYSWNTKSDGKGNNYEFGDEYEVDGHAVLFAQWTSKKASEPVTLPAAAKDKISNTRTVYFEGVGGSPDKKFMTASAETTYSFDGWVHDGKIIGTKGDSYTPEDHTTLTAKFTSSPGTDEYIILPDCIRDTSFATYNVTLNYNCDNLFPDEYEEAKSTKKYKLRGWYTQATDGTFVGTANSRYDPPASVSTTLFAQWDTAITTDSIELPVRERTGYTFKEWNTRKDGVGISYNGSITPETNVTLYAIWSVQPRGITYDANGGKPSTQYQKVDYGTPTSLKFDTPTRTGYTFLGWSKNSSDTSATYTSGSTITITENITLYAVWEPIVYYVKYVGGEGSTGSMSIVAHRYDKYEYLTANSFKKANHTFAGWSNGDKSYADKQLVKNLSSVDGATVELKAKWNYSPIDVTYHVHEHERPYINYKASKILSITEVKNNGRIKILPSHNFVEWRIGSVNGKTATSWSDIEQNASNDNPRTIHLYAVFEPRYKVVYKSESGLRRLSICYGGDKKLLYPYIKK